MHPITEALCKSALVELRKPHRVTETKDASDALLERVELIKAQLSAASLILSSASKSITPLAALAKVAAACHLRSSGTWSIGQTRQPRTLPCWPMLC